MARQRFGDPDYYTRPEREPVELGIPEAPTQEAPEPEPDLGVPEPDFDVSYAPGEVEEQVAPPVEREEAFTMAKQPEAPLATEQDKEDSGWWANAGSGLMNRAGDLLANLGKYGEKVTGKLPDVPFAPIMGAKALSKWSSEAGEGLRDEFDYQVRGDWETVEKAWKKVADAEETETLDVLDAATQTGEFMLETGIVSLWDMFAMIAAMPLYLGSRVEEIATDRAEKNGRQEPSAEDYAVGATTATIVTGIDKLSLGYATKPMKELMEGGAAAAMKRIAKATGVETAQEAVQEGLEYAGTSVGTQEGATLEEGLRRSLAGAVGGFGFGAGVSTAAELGSAVIPPTTDTPPVDVPPTGEVPVGRPGDDDYLPTAEEAAVSEKDIIPPPPEPAEQTPEPVAEEPAATTEAVVEPSVDREQTPEKFEQDIAKAWSGLGLKKPQKDFVKKHGIMPGDVEPTGKAGSYTLGDLQRAFDARKSVESDEQLAKVLKDAGLKEAAVSTEGDGGTGGTGAGPAVEGDAGEAVAGEEAVAEAEGEPEPVAKTLDDLKFTRGTKAIAAEAGLTPDDLTGITLNDQGNIPRAAVEQLVRELARGDRGDVSKETADVLNYVEDNFPAGNYDTAKTGRTRQGKLSDKVAAVSSLVDLTKRLMKNTTAPDEVQARAGELAANYSRIGKVSADQEAGKGFTSTIKAGVLDPLLDELTELVTALDQNRAAKEGTIKAGTLEKLKEVATTVEEKVKAKEPEKELSTKEVAEAKAKLATKREKVRKAAQLARRMRGAEARTEALKKTKAAESAVAAEEANLDKRARVTEKAEPVQKKRAKPGEKVVAPKGEEVKAAKFTSATEARNVMNTLGVPELVTGVEGKISELPVDPNHYSLMVGLYKNYRKQETTAAKSKDARGEQEAKSKLRKLAEITKDIISTPDELREGAHTKAAGDLAKMDVPKSVIDDVIDFAESARVVTQREQKRAADITEEIREIAAEEDFDDYGMESIEEEEYYGESETIALSDEYDPNEAEYGSEFRQYKQAPGYFGGETEAESKLPPGHNKRKEAQARALAAVLDVAAPKAGRGTKALAKRADAALRKLGVSFAQEVKPFENEGEPLNGAAVLNYYAENLPAWHPYSVLSKMMASLAPKVDVIFAPTGDKVARSAGFHDFGTAMIQSEETAEWQWSGGNPRIVIDTAKFMQNPQQGMKVLMHEMVHHFTAVSTRMDNEAAQYLDQLRVATLQAVDDLQLFGTFEGTTRKLNGGEIYGLSNIDEFIAEAFTNPQFQYLLMSLEAPRTEAFSGRKSGVKQSVWEALITAIKRIIGLPQVRRSVLEEVVAHSDNIFYNAEQTYDPANTPLTPGQRISSHWYDRSMRSGDDKVWRTSKTAGETSVVETWTQDRARTEDAARDALGGERGADWGRQAHETMEGNDPQTVGDLREGTPASEERVVSKIMGRLTGNPSLSKVREWVGASSLALQTMDQIERNHGDKFGGKLSDYMNIQRERNRISQRWQNRGAAIDEQWQGVESAGNARRFSQYVQDVTMAEVQPDYGWENQKHLYGKKERAVKEAQHAELHDRFKKLSNAEQKLFKDMRRFFTAQRKELAHSAVKHIARTYVTDESLADEVHAAVVKHGSVEKAIKADPQVAGAFANASDKMKESIKRVMDSTKVRGAYFPLRRYGNWVVEYSRSKDLGTFETKKEAVAATREWMKEHPSNKAKAPKKTDDGKYHAVVEERGVEFADSIAQGKRIIAEVKQQGWNTTNNPTLKEDWGGRFDVGALQVLQQAKKKFRKDPSESKAQNKRNEAVEAALDTAFIELLADNSIRKSTLQRKNVRGASLEGRRVFAERVFAGSYALADSETMIDQNNALQEVWNKAREGETTKAGQVAKELTLRERHNVNDRRSNAFNDWVGSLGFLGFLAGPSYPIINATQPYMVGLPWLGARYGAAANTVLFKNAAKLGPAVMKELIDSGMGVRRNPHQAVQNAINAMAKRGGGGADMLRAMRDAGIMDSTFIDAVSEAAKPGGWNLSQTSIFKFAASAPKVVEVMNRAVMGASAYELEMKKSGNKGKAIDQAKEAILQTQFDYSDFNKPRWFKQPVARPFLLFKMYPQGIYGLMASSVRQMVNGSPTERRQGLNTMLGLTASHTVMAGALGGIFMEPVRMLLSAIEMLWPGDEDDKENFPFWDKQQFDINMRQVAVDVLGDEWMAELAMRGIPRAVGLDLSGRLGLHNLMFMGMADDGTGKNAVHKTIDQMGGAPMSVMTSWERAYQFALNGDMQRAMETAAPKALRDMMGSYRAGTRGLETFGGSRYAAPDQFDPMDHFFQMTGFSSAKKAELMEERWAQMSYDKKMTARKGQWLNRWHQGSVTFADVNREWNMKHPDYRLTMGDLLRKRAGQMKDEMKTSKGYPVNLQKPSIRREARF